MADLKIDVNRALRISSLKQAGLLEIQPGIGATLAVRVTDYYDNQAVGKTVVR